MFNTDSINFVELKLLEGQVDLLLDALQLYAFNFHHVWSINIDSDKEELRNSLLFHTFNQIQQSYNNSRVVYDVSYNCRLNSHRNKMKKFKKIA